MFFGLRRLHLAYFEDDAARKSWHERILSERTRRIDEYRQRTTGTASLWDVWRAGLPQGKQIGEIATRRLKLWAKALDPDFAHSERVARLGLQLYDGLKAAGLFQTLITENPQPDGDPRSSLYAGALLHDVGKSKGKKGHHKDSRELIQKHGTPLGWTEIDMRRAALVARFHCGALPARSHKALRDLFPEEQRIIIRLAAILRLANALDFAHDGQVKRVRVENIAAPPRRANGLPYKRIAPRPQEALMIDAEGFIQGSRTAQAVAGERYLLETVLRRPIVIKPMKAVRSPL